MGLLSFLLGRKTEESLQIREVPGGSNGGGGSSKSASIQVSPANIKQFWIKAVGFSGEDSTGDFQEPEYDLAEIKEACTADSYIAVAVQKYSQLIFKAGYSIVSDNQNAAEYVRQRLRFMSFATKIPFDILIQGIAEDLVRYSNAFLVKSRVEQSQLGGIQAVGVWDNKPVGGYFRVDPTTIKIKRDKNGAVKNYQQEVGSNTKSFKDLDIIHFYIDKDGNAAFGLPRLAAVIEDVKMLRKLEGSTLSQVYRYANPITQVKIGLEQPEGWATQQEITDAQKEFEKYNNDGLIITNERTNIISVGADGEALDIKPYLDYFEKRVFSALNVSASMMGRGGAKQDADSMEEQEHDTVKFFQKQIATFIEQQMFVEMLQEGGFDPIGNADDIVRFKFEEINLETRIKKETHALNLYQGNLVPFDEARFRIGKDAEVDENLLYMNMIVTPHDLTVAQAKGAATGTSNGTAATTSQRTTAAKVQPSNQHGTTTMKVKESQVDVMEAMSEKTKQHRAEFREKFEKVYEKWRSARNDIVENGEMPSLILPIARDAIIKEFKDKAAVQTALGVQHALRETRKSVDSVRQISTRLLDDKIESVVTKVFKDIHKRLKKLGKDGTKTDKQAIFDVCDYRIRFLSEHIIPKAYWYGYVKMCQQLMVPEVFVHFHGSEDQKEYKTIVKTNKFSLDDIPAFHAYCSCTVGLEEEKEVT